MGYLKTAFGLIDTYETKNRENADAKAELFNLQGIRIANPQEGQLYILRKGNSVRKVVF